MAVITLQTLTGNSWGYWLMTKIINQVQDLPALLGVCDTIKDDDAQKWSLDLDPRDPH